jgi:predicted kinase
MKLLLLKGLPASGKSTYAKELCKDPTWKRVNKDDIRAMANNNIFNKNEKDVIQIRNMLVEHWLSKGYNVVVDDTNLNPVHNTYFFDKYSTEHEVQGKTFDVPVEKCIEYDLNRECSVGSDVIYTMYNKYCDKREMYTDTHKKPYCVICDIDGTLAKNTGRNPYSTQVMSDAVHIHTSDLISWIPYDIVFFSGRSEEARGETLRWLEYHNITNWKELHMRALGDNRKDSIIKKEMFETHIKDRYHTKFVIDDRPQVIRMWKLMGIPVFNADQRMYYSEF